MTKKVLFLAKRWGHHTASGGYDRILRYMPGFSPEFVVLPPAPSYSFGKLGFKFLKRLKSLKHLDLYCYEDLLAERRALSLAKKKEANVIHSLYSDEQLNLLLKPDVYLPCPLIGTFHFIVSRMKERYLKSQRESLKRLSAAIAVSTVQREFLLDILGPDKVFFVPHGVDTTVFVSRTKKIQKTLKLFLLAIT